jgi:pilus assembly protein CpaC
MKCGRNNPAMWTVLGRVASCSAIAALLLNPALSPVIAADSESHLAPMATAGSKTRFLALGVGKSVIVDLSRDAKDVLVADPKIANAVVRSSQRAYIIGAAVGQTNVVFFDADGQ